MIKNQSIICTPLTTWDSAFTNTVVKMMHLLSRHNKILFVDYQYTLKDVFTSMAGKKDVPLQRILGIQERLREVKTEIGSSVYVLTPPPVIPINWIKQNDPYRFFLKLNAGIVKSSIQKAAKELKIENPIILNGYNPFLGWPLAGAFNEMLNIYYCYDEIKGDQWYNFHGPKVEEDYMKKADLVITTSDALYRSKCSFNNKCYVVKNGVDFDVFHPAAFHQKPKDAVKIIGYTGSMDERFDTDLMCYAVEKLWQCQFEFVGRVTNEQARHRLEQYPNVKIYGSRRPDEVPQFLRSMDVCVIPYLKNQVTSGVYPLKINEYLAAGKPVVMTDFADIPEFDGIVRFAGDKEQFVRQISEELQTDNKDKKEIRIGLARKNSWNHRVEEFSNIVESYLELKYQKTA